MSFRLRFRLQRQQTAGVLSVLALSSAAACAQYSTPVGRGVAKPKTLRATAVLEWTGSLEKPNASRLMPLAVWDGEHYQPAGLYLARPEPLAFETGTQYELERNGEPAGLFDVRGAAELQGEWIGMGKFQPEAPPPPPPKLKVSKKLPTLSNGKPATGDKSPDSSQSTDDGRPTLHRKTTDSSPAGSSGSAGSTGNGSAQPAGSSTPGGSGTASGSGTGSTTGTGSGTGSTTGTGSDPNGPTLHKRTPSADTSDSSGTSSSSTSKAPDTDPDRPTLHHKDDSARASDVDPDRPTLHRARPAGGDAAIAPDPDRPHLRYGRADDGDSAVLPARLEGAPPTMQQMVAVSDATTGEIRGYQYHWANAEDGVKMQAAVAVLAAQAVAKVKAGAAMPSSAGPGAAKPGTQFGPASRAAAAHRTATQGKGRAARQAAAPLPVLTDEHFSAYELSFSGGATLVYSAHTIDEGPQRMYVTLIAQPDFADKPQVLLQQVARGDRLDETPAMQLVDALDTDDDQKAELIFQLNGAAQPVGPAATPAEAEQAPTGTAHEASSVASAAAAASAAAVSVPEREFAIYRVANGKASQVFTTGPLP